MKIKNPILEVSKAYGRLTYRCGKVIINGLYKTVKPLCKAIKHVAVGYVKVARWILAR